MILAFVRRRYGWLRTRLFRKYVLIIGSLVFGALLVSGGLDVYFTYRATLNSISVLELEEASFAASNIDFFIGDVQRNLKRAVQVEYPESESGIAARKSDYLALINRVPAITKLGYWDSKGQEQLIAAQFGRNTFSSESLLPEEQILIEAMNGEIFNGPVYYEDDLIQYMTMGIAEPGTGKGVLIAEVNLSMLQVLISQFSLADSEWAYVVDSDGFIVSHPAAEYATQRTNVSHLPQVKNAIEAGIDPSGRFARASVSVEKSLDGQSVVANSFPISSLGWQLIVEHPRSEALASLQAPIIRNVLLLVGGLFLAVLTSLILARKVVPPIREPNDAANTVRLGSPDGEVDLKTGDELESLDQAFSRESAKVRESHATSDVRVERRARELARTIADLEAAMIEQGTAERMAFLLHRAMEHSPHAVMITDTEAKIEYVNPKFTEFTGYATEEVVGRTARILQSVRTGWERYDRLRDTAQAGEQWDGEEYDEQKNGKFYCSFETVSPIKNDQGVTTHYLAMEQDVTDGKNVEDEAEIANQRLADMNRTLNQRVTGRTSELQANDRLIEANNILVRTEKLAAIGELSASLAHDLRSPLGSIKNAIYYLSGKLLGSKPAKENPKIPEFLKIIDEEVGHANKIISDLLEFTRISTPTFSPVNLGTLVQDCLDKLDVNEGIDINILDNHHEDLFQVQADDQQLHRVFKNLILNAQDAMPDGGVISVSTNESDGFAEVAVSDSGEGIKPELINKIFDPLFTTRTKGIGLGLAVCQQIVSKHGGTIEVESRPGEGAMFNVRLPLAASNGLAQEA